MKISEVKTAIKVGEIKESERQYQGNRYVLYKYPLEIIYDENFPEDLKHRALSIAYLFVVNGEIYKIGKTNSRNGIAGCLGFYLNAGTDNCGPNRFVINWYMREVLKESKTLEVYMIYLEEIKIKIPGLFSKSEQEQIVLIDSRFIEQASIKDFVERENEKPLWNMQESGQRIPENIRNAYNDYREKRD